MLLTKVFAEFVAESPVCVMYRGLVEHVFSASRLDALFEKTAQRQYCSELLFSTCTDLLSLVVLGAQKSLHSAYVRQQDKVGVSVKAVYDKLAGIETNVSEVLVRDTATDLAAVIEQLGPPPASLLPGYEVRIVDGNHLPATHHRLKELRQAGAAPLPGHAAAIWNPQLGLIEDVLLCEDGHASERTLLPRLLEKVRPGQCWIEDRNYCTVAFLRGIDERNAHFVVRHHARLSGTPVGRRKKVGRVDSGIAHEQAYELPTPEGGVWTIRRITIVLDEPTRDGDGEVHLLTNLPAKVSAQCVAQLYQNRWQIEAAFRELATTLRSEINSLGYPPAALFGFCLAVAVYNIMNTLRAALQIADAASSGKPKKAPPADSSQEPAHKRKEPSRRFSPYYLAEEISGVYRGMMIAIDGKHWTAAFGQLDSRQMAHILLGLAKRVRLSSFYANSYDPRHREPKKKLQRRKKGSHVSTHKLLLERRKTTA